MEIFPQPSHRKKKSRNTSLWGEILDGRSQAKEKVLLKGANNYNSAITDQTLFP